MEPTELNLYETALAMHQVQQSFNRLREETPGEPGTRTISVGSLYTRFYEAINADLSHEAKDSVVKVFLVKLVKATGIVGDTDEDS